MRRSPRALRSPAQAAAGSRPDRQRENRLGRYPRERWRRSVRRSSEIAEGFVVFGRIPFPEEGERILERRAAARLGRLGQEDMSVLYGVSYFVARLDPQRGADRLWNGCLSLAREFAGDHAGASSIRR